MSDEHLDKLHISYAGELCLKTDSKSRAAKTDPVGEDQDWSADKLYRHLCFLENLVPRTVSMFNVEYGEPFLKVYEPE